MRKFFVIYGLGLLGVLSLLLSEQPLPPGLELVMSKEQFRFIALINPAIFVLIFGTLGSIFASRVGISSYAAGIYNDRSSLKIRELVRLFLYVLPMLILTAYWLKINKSTIAPAEPSLITRLLYGSLSEEIISRFGFISLILAFLNKSTSKFLASKKRYLFAIFASSVFFAVSHFGVVPLYFDPSFTVYLAVFFGNFITGAVASYLLVSQCLEASMIFHALVGIALHFASMIF